MLEMVVDSFRNLKNKQLIHIFSQADCSSFHLDASAKLLGDENVVLSLKGQTAGALCTCLMAVEYIDNDIPLIIMNSDQILNVEFQSVIDYFRKNNGEAGVITFHSIHPRWSYVKLQGGGEKNEVIETAEKRPLSSNAIAGFYYYEYGRDFVEAAKKVILKKNALDHRFYISSTLNEMILQNKRVIAYSIEPSQYHSFYSPEKIKEFEQM